MTPSSYVVRMCRVVFDRRVMIPVFRSTVIEVEASQRSSLGKRYPILIAVNSIVKIVHLSTPIRKLSLVKVVLRRLDRPLKFLCDKGTDETRLIAYRGTKDTEIMERIRVCSNGVIIDDKSDTWEGLV
uniref:DUF5641 domain-containing protein n=1 Tax=Panagrellus redivivus TaxID=6233 RepID=A0A7E4VYX4_PANRE